MALINHIDLVNKLSYNPCTGVFKWKISSQNIYKGDAAGSLRPDGYLQIGINKKLYFAHRLAWLYCYKNIPIEIDHKDGNKLNNSIWNLRECTRAENAYNTIKQNKLNLKGVHYDCRRGTYTSRITVNGNTINLGTFYTAEQAHAAYAEAAKKYHGQFARIS